MKVRVVPKDIFTKCFVNDPCNCVLYQVRIFSIQASHVSIRLLIEMISLIWKLRCSPGIFGIIMQMDKKVKMGTFVLAKMIDFNFHEEVGLLLHNGGRKECVWRLEDLLGCLYQIPKW